MNRRGFVSRVALGAAAACTGVGKLAHSAPASGGLTVRFVGMMTFIERSDRSYLVATPGQHGTHHMTHVPFLMARAGSPVAKALGMTPAAGVVPAAFDTRFIGTNPAEFVYRNLANTSIEITSGNGDAVKNDATEMAHLADIAPGKRVRGNIEKWASSTISLRGGRIENSAGHPDAGKVWSFGNYRQKLTDAVNFKNADGPTTIRISSGTDARTCSIATGESCDLTMISAAVPDARAGNPTRLVHSELLFEYLVDATPVLAECAEATGREVPATEIPYVTPTSAGRGVVAGGRAFPPFTDFCFVADIVFGPRGSL